jgi:hypothetical protein
LAFGEVCRVGLRFASAAFGADRGSAGGARARRGRTGVMSERSRTCFRERAGHGPAGWLLHRDFMPVQPGFGMGTLLSGASGVLHGRRRRSTRLGRVVRAFQRVQYCKLPDDGPDRGVFFDAGYAPRPVGLQLVVGHAALAWWEARGAGRGFRWRGCGSRGFRAIRPWCSRSPRGAVGARRDAVWKSAHNAHIQSRRGCLCHPILWTPKGRAYVMPRDLVVTVIPGIYRGPVLRPRQLESEHLGFPLAPSPSTALQMVKWVNASTRRPNRRSQLRGVCLPASRGISNVLYAFRSSPPWRRSRRC